MRLVFFCLEISRKGFPKKNGTDLFHSTDLPLAVVRREGGGVWALTSKHTESVQASLNTVSGLCLALTP